MATYVVNLLKKHTEEINHIILPKLSYFPVDIRPYKD